MACTQQLKSFTKTCCRTRVGAARDMDDRESEFANGVEPSRVVVADQPLPVQPLEAGIVCVKLKWFVQEIQAEGAQRVHHGQELETVGRVAAFQDGEFARFIGQRLPGPLVVRLFQN